MTDQARPDCICGPWHPDMDGPDEACPRHGRPYSYWTEYAAELEQRISHLLCDLTDGRLSKPGYALGTMLREIEHVQEQRVEEAVREAEAAVERVRELHRPMTHLGHLYCLECSDGLLMEHPCLTIRALDGETDDE